MSPLQGAYLAGPDYKLIHPNVASDEFIPPIGSDHVIIDVYNDPVDTDSLQKPSSCLSIAKQVLTAFPPEEQKTIADVAESGTDDESGSEDLDPYQFYEFFTHEILAPDENNKKKRAYNILASAEKLEQPSWANEYCIDEQVWSDLNLLFGNKEHPTTFLGEILCKDRTHSEIGRAYFNGLLARPVENITLLQSRQRIVREFAENGPLFSRLNEVVKEFAEHESMFTGLWGKEQLMQFIKAGDYFSFGMKTKKWPRVTKVLNCVNKKLNDSALALDAKTTLEKVGSAYGHVLSNVTPVVLSVYGFTRLFAEPPGPAAEYTDAWMTASLFAPSLGILLALPYLLKNRATQGGSATVAGITQVAGIQRTWKQFFVNFKFDDFLRKRIAHIARNIKMMQKLSELIPQDMQHDLLFFKHLDKIFNELPKTNAEFAYLLKMIDSKTFWLDSSDSTSCFFRRGKVLSVYRMLGRFKAVFEPAMAAVGEIDAFLTAAKIIKESANAKVQFCFPQYLQNKKAPYVELQTFWNVFLDPQLVITNSLAIGFQAKVPHAVVTGPNSSGKSTIFCKGIPLAIIMAQSLGIAPARKMALTPFAHIAVYMNVADSLVDKESRFQREAKQAFAHGDHIKALSEQGSFSLAVFDEIFSGTSPEEGAKWGYLTAKGFSKYQNCICLVATHFKKLTDLEEDTNGHFVNFKVSIEVDRYGGYKRDFQGRLKRTYTLERGISHQHIAEEVLQEQGERSPFFLKNFRPKKTQLFNPDLNRYGLKDCV